MRRHIHRRRDDRGASAVEFALVVPVLMLVLVGIVNFGIVLAQQVSLNNAARQAVRYAVVDGRTCGDIKEAGKVAAATVGMDDTYGSTPSVQDDPPTPEITNCGADSVQPCATSAPNTDITVTMTRDEDDYDWTITAPPFNLLAVPTLEGVGVMRCEFS